MKKMTCFIDIDQTISTGYVSQDVAASVQYYRDRGLTIPDGITSWPVLFQLPEVVPLHEVLPHAQEGVYQLARRGEVWYATARKPDVAVITRDWLAAHAFPFPDQVLFVTGVAEKLLALANYPGALVLVDDRWRQLYEILLHSGKKHRVLADLLTRLTLIAFGARKEDIEDIAEKTIVPIVPLSTWASVDSLCGDVHFEDA